MPSHRYFIFGLAILDVHNFTHATTTRAPTTPILDSLYVALDQSKPQKVMLILIIDLGHAFSFIKDAQGVVSNGIKYFGDSNEPFGLTIGGERLYIVTSSSDVGAVYKNTSTLSWDAMLNDLILAFGVDSLVIPKLWEKPQAGTTGATTTNRAWHELSAIYATMDLYRRQLLPGERLDVFSEVLLGHINHPSSWKSFERRQSVTSPGISLHYLCAKILVGALTRTMFGDAILEIEPNIVQYLIDFNDDAWMLHFHIPQRAGSKLNVARGHILQGFIEYMQSPEQVLSGRAWVIEEVMKVQQAVEISNKDRAALLLMIYWAANINVYNTAFWMLSYILFDQKVLTALRAETAPAYQDGNLDLQYLMQHCPHLNSMFQETLRTVNFALSARKIVASTPLGTKVLSSGATIIIPFRQLHFDKAVFGDGRFESERFLKDPTLKNNASYKPFGGGASYCPGRILAKQELLYFVALVLNRFDIDLATRDSRGKPILTPQTFPKLDEFTPALGINGPVKGSDVYVDILKRKG